MINHTTAALLTALMATSLSGCLSGKDSTNAAATGATVNLISEANHRQEARRKRNKDFRTGNRTFGRNISTTNCLIASVEALAEAADALEDRKSIKRFLPKDGSSSQKGQKELFKTMGIESVYGSGGGGGGGDSGGGDC
jgi:hypothetical protein